MENFNNDPITSRVYKLRDEALQKAAKTVNKYARPRIIAALFEMVVSMVMTLGISIVTMLFDFSVVTTWQFWVKILLLSVCMFLLFRAVVNALFYKTSEREEAVEKRDKYKDLSDKKELDLKDYLVEFNLPISGRRQWPPHSSTVARRIPWMEEPGKLQSMGLLRVRHY